MGNGWALKIDKVWSVFVFSQNFTVDYVTGKNVLGPIQL